MIIRGSNNDYGGGPGRGFGGPGGGFHGKIQCMINPMYQKAHCREIQEAAGKYKVYQGFLQTERKYRRTYKNRRKYRKN